MLHDCDQKFLVRSVPVWCLILLVPKSCSCLFLHQVSYVMSYTPLVTCADTRKLVMKLLCKPKGRISARWLLRFVIFLLTVCFVTCCLWCAFQAFQFVVFIWRSTCSAVHLSLITVNLCIWAYGTCLCSILQVEKKRKRKAQEKDGKAKKQKDFKF